MEKKHFLRIIEYLCLISIPVISFLLYAPCFYPEYNSDMAIQTLMSVSFNFKRDFYYWGQDRLGSFLPLLTYLFFKISHVHPLYLISFIHYTLLLASGIIIIKLTESLPLKIMVFVAIFFPCAEFRALIYVGHPYSAQLFLGVIFLYSLKKAHDLLLLKSDYRLKVWLLLAGFSLGLAIWVSELSAILIFIPLFYFLLNFKIYKQNLLKKQAVIYVLSFIIPLSICLFTIKYFKSKSKISDGYSSPFFFSKEKIDEQWYYFKTKAAKLLLFQDDLIIDNIFFYVIFIMCLIFLLEKRLSLKSNTFLLSVFITFVLGYIALFFSTWNLRSEFCTRYYTPIFYMIFLTLIINLSQSRFKYFISVLFVIYSVYYTHSFLNNLYVSRTSKSAFDKFSEYSKLEKGVLMGNYWDVYLISSVAYKNIIPAPTTGLFRNDFVRNKIRKENLYYLINDTIFNKTKNIDTILKLGIRLKFTGERKTINGVEILKYKKL